MKSISKLMPFLNKQLEVYADTITNDVKSFSKTEGDYRNLQYNKEFCIVLRKEKTPAATKNIGFPFPVYSEELEKNSIKNSEISTMAFLRGEPIRECQRNLLIEELAKEFAGKLVNVPTNDQFRKLTKEICLEQKTCSYFDPYTFIGDSFIGLHFLDNFARAFDLKAERIYSNAHEHLAHFYQAKNYSPDRIDSFEGLAIMPDLLDNQWDKTIATIKQILKKKSSIFVIGRNLAITKVGEELKVYHLSKDDPLLRDQNIEDYMNACLNGFLGPKRKATKAIQHSAFNLIINPFGSEEIKTLPLEMVVSLANKTAQHYPNSKIVVIEGLPNVPAHNGWVANFKKEIVKKNLAERIVIKNYLSLSEIAQDIETMRMRFGLTADTSLAHMFNHIGLENVTVYNKKRWDPKSAQSLSSDSPLGFCRYGAIQYPTVLCQNNVKESTDAIFDCFVYLFNQKEPLIKTAKFYQTLDTLDNRVRARNLEKAHKQIGEQYKKISKEQVPWATILFDPRKILNESDFNCKNERITELFYAAWALTPVNKINERGA